MRTEYLPQEHDIWLSVIDDEETHICNVRACMAESLFRSIRDNTFTFGVFVYMVTDDNPPVHVGEIKIVPAYSCAFRYISHAYFVDAAGFDACVLRLVKLHYKGRDIC